jgi:hypothetical protein
MKRWILGKLSTRSKSQRSQSYHLTRIVGGWLAASGGIRAISKNPSRPGCRASGGNEKDKGLLATLLPPQHQHTTDDP